MHFFTKHFSMFFYSIKWINAKYIITIETEIIQCQLKEKPGHVSI